MFPPSTRPDVLAVYAFMTTLGNHLPFVRSPIPDETAVSDPLPHGRLGFLRHFRPVGDCGCRRGFFVSGRVS